MDGIVEYQPTTLPGARLPHAMVLDEGRPVPVHDTLLHDGLTLLTASPQDWTSALDGLETPTGLRIAVTGLISPDQSHQDDLVALFEVDTRGAVLVRPDGHVAWRTTKSADEGAADLTRFLEQHWHPFWQQESRATSLVQS